jgi:purine-binding chemotaxis protein CheW
MNRPQQPAGRTVQLATFLVGGEEYALDIMRIKEIINPQRVTPVPRVPVFIEGVIELRGAIIPIVDLRKRFELPVTPPVRATKYLIVAIEGRIVGLVVDAVGEVLRLTEADIKSPPELVTPEAAGLFAGVCKLRGRIIMILDIDKILSSRERLSLAGLPRSDT